MVSTSNGYLVQKNNPLMFTGQILYIWIAITEYVQSAFSGPPAFSGPSTCSFFK